MKRRTEWKRYKGALDRVGLRIPHGLCVYGYRYTSSDGHGYMLHTCRPKSEHCGGGKRINWMDAYNPWSVKFEKWKGRVCTAILWDGHKLTDKDRRIVNELCNKD